jgi:citrate synthase
MREPVSHIDSKQGVLYFRGIDATTLAADFSYESVLYHLITGRRPTSLELATIQEELQDLRTLSPELWDRDPNSRPEFSTSLSEIAHVIGTYAEKEDVILRQALLALVSMTATIVASQYRLKQGLEIVKPRTDLHHAENLLWMLRGTVPSNQDTKDFETGLILHMDDPDNPSLSALQETWKHTGDLKKALYEAFNAHIDPLHHGAGHLAMEMLREVNEAEDIELALLARLERGDKIYGIGHRIYRTHDPRGVVLKDMLAKRTARTDDAWIETATTCVAEIAQRLLKKRKGIIVHPNVDLFNAAVYHTFGLSSELNTHLFAVSRVAGWTAHLLEWNREEE